MFCGSSFFSLCNLAIYQVSCYRPDKLGPNLNQSENYDQDIKRTRCWQKLDNQFALSEFLLNIVMDSGIHKRRQALMLINNRVRIILIQALFFVLTGDVVFPYCVITV